MPEHHAHPMSPIDQPPIDQPPIDQPPPRVPLAALGWNDRWLALYVTDAPEGAEPGRVLRHDGSAVLAGFATGSRQVPLRPATPPLAVGDWISVSGGAITHVLDRTSLLQRADPSTGHEQLLAANVDVVVIVCGLDRPIKAGRIQRTATLAWDAGATPLVVLTKADLAVDLDADLKSTRAADPALDVLAVSARSGHGLDELTRLAAGRTLVLIGESGAGKSTLVNVLSGGDVAPTQHVRQGDAKGRHTTSARQLHLLPGGTCLIDTPGIRAVGLSADTGSVDDAFADILEQASGCRFRDCTHTAEPGCAVLAAVDSGDLPAQRWESWQRLRREALAMELRADEAARRRFEKRFARVAREAQRHKGRR